MKRFDLTGLHINKQLQEMKMTILHRPGGTWSNADTNRLNQGLSTECSGHHKHPEYLILFGHFTKDETLKALIGGLAYTATQVTGIDSPELPFSPGFC